MLWDKLAVRDSIYLDIRTAIPLSYSADSVWQDGYELALDSMVRSFRVGGHQVFPPIPNNGDN